MTDMNILMDVVATVLTLATLSSSTSSLPKFDKPELKTQPVKTKSDEVQQNKVINSGEINGRFFTVIENPTGLVKLAAHNGKKVWTAFDH